MNMKLEFPAAGRGRNAGDPLKMLPGQRTVLASVGIPGGEHIVLSTSADEDSDTTRVLIGQLLRMITPERQQKL